MLMAAEPVDDGERETLKLFEIPFNLAVMMAVCGFVTVPMFAVKPLLPA